MRLCPCASAFPSASANSAAVANRSAGVLASDCCNAAATCAGTAGRTTLMLGGSAARCCRTTLSAVAPVNGGCPASISYNTQPRE